jgi:ribosome-associated protein
MNLPEAPPQRDDIAPPPSKTRRKQAMNALQDLGVALVALDARRLATLGLPERLVDAITLARTLTRHEARRRQMQFIGRLMREVDPEPLRSALAAWAQGPEQERARFAAVERWRDRLIDDPDGLQAFVETHPSASRTALAALLGDLRAERARGAPPHKSRALFRELKRIIDNAAP